MYMIYDHLYYRMLHLFGFATAPDSAYTVRWNTSMSGDVFETYGPRNNEYHPKVDDKKYVLFNHH